MRTTGWMMLAALAVAGCSSATGEGKADPNAGVLSFYGDPPEVIAPESVTAGQPFTVAIRTYGGGCVRQGTTEVSVQGSTAHLRPYDIHTETAGGACTGDVLLFRHEASVRFDQPGPATLRVHGVYINRNGNSAPLVVTRTLMVR